MIKVQENLVEAKEKTGEKNVRSFPCLELRQLPIWEVLLEILREPREQDGRQGDGRYVNVPLQQLRGKLGAKDVHWQLDHSTHCHSALANAGMMRECRFRPGAPSDH